MTVIKTTLTVEIEVPDDTTRIGAQPIIEKYRQWLESSRKWKTKVKEIGYLDVRKNDL